ncbi:hypothetical protein Tco_1361680 [Tanacetum coccineum]
MASFIQWYCKQIGKKMLVKADFQGQAYKIVRPFHKNNTSLQIKMEECHLLLTDQIDLINPEGNRVVYDMSKPLPLGGQPGFLHYKHTVATSDRNAVRSHMKILSVVSLKTYSRYGYTFLKEIVLRRADYKEYEI